MAEFLVHEDGRGAVLPAPWLLLLRAQLFSTTPPFALQVFSVSGSQPWPLQEFCPLQPFFAVEHSLLPLHEFTPLQ
jgi:hypothetical protein